MPSYTKKTFEKVRYDLTDALGVDDDEVVPEATIAEDLGAESIDFLDIMYRLRKSFKIEFKMEELSFLNLTDYQFTSQDLESAPGGKTVLNKNGLAKWPEKLKHIDPTTVTVHDYGSSIYVNLTVGLLCQTIQRLLP